MSEVEISREKYATEISAETRFVRDSSLFSISLVLVGIFGLIRSFYIAKFLGPQGFGTWRFVRIFEQYVHLASLGTGPAMHRKIPFLRGKGDLKGLRNVLSITWAINFYTSILYSAVVFAISFFVAETSSARALAAFSPVTFLLAWRLYAFTFLMDTGLYGLRSRLEIVYAASTMLFSLALVTIWGVYGAIAGWGVSALIIVFISTRKLWQYLSFRIDWRNLWDLMVTGFPVMADTMLPITMHNADRIMIAAMLSRELLGIYSVGFAGVAILIMIPSALGQMLFVKFAELDGQNRTKEHISNVQLPFSSQST
jgi:O-antigen/teichoic acid export membrane protein